MEDFKVTYHGGFVTVTFKERKEDERFRAFSAAQRGAIAGAVASALNCTPHVASMSGTHEFTFRRN